MEIWNFKIQLEHRISFERKFKLSANLGMFKLAFIVVLYRTDYASQGVQIDRISRHIHFDILSEQKRESFLTYFGYDLISLQS